MLPRIVLSLGFAFVASADPFTDIGNILDRRATVVGGGWALMSNDSSCPGGTSLLSSTNGVACCPTSYLAQSTSGAGSHLCCSRGADCLASLQATPYCAKTEWVLWNSTIQVNGDGYFCCRENETGTKNMTCGTNVLSANAAARLGRPVPSSVILPSSTPTGTKTSNSGGSAVTSASSTTSVAVAITSTSTTSTTSGSASATVKSNSAPLERSKFGVSGMILLAVVATL